MAGAMRQTICSFPYVPSKTLWFKTDQDNAAFLFFFYRQVAYLKIWQEKQEAEAFDFLLFLSIGSHRKSVSYCR